jgi:hypothetical protein
VEYVPRGEKEQKELQTLRTAMLLINSATVPQLEVLCSAFFQESEKSAKKRRRLSFFKRRRLYFYRMVPKIKIEVLFGSFSFKKKNTQPFSVSAKAA